MFVVRAFSAYVTGSMRESKTFLFFFEIESKTFLFLMRRLLSTKCATYSVLWRLSYCFIFFICFLRGNLIFIFHSYSTASNSSYIIMHNYMGMTDSTNSIFRSPEPVYLQMCKQRQIHSGQTARASAF